MKNSKGFTLVELLAVIVILAIIMIIAIPSVLKTMDAAKQKTFVEYCQKLYSKIQERVVLDDAQGVFNSVEYDINDYRTVVYDIKNDLGIDNTGDYYGFIYAGKKSGMFEFFFFIIDDEKVCEWNTLDDFYPNNYSDFEIVESIDALGGLKGFGFTEATHTIIMNAQSLIQEYGFTPDLNIGKTLGGYAYIGNLT